MNFFKAVPVFKPLYQNWCQLAFRTIVHKGPMLECQIATTFSLLDVDGKNLGIYERGTALTEIDLKKFAFKTIDETVEPPILQLELLQNETERKPPKKYFFVKYEEDLKSMTKFELKMAEKAKAKKAKIKEKEVTIRGVIDVGAFEIKVRQISQFLELDYKVKILITRKASAKSEVTTLIGLYHKLMHALENKCEIAAGPMCDGKTIALSLKKRDATLRAKPIPEIKIKGAAAEAKKEDEEKKQE